jgi:hypothetical protein
MLKVDFGEKGFQQNTRPLISTQNRDMASIVASLLPSAEKRI